MGVLAFLTLAFLAFISVDEVKAAVLIAYQNEESPLNNSGPPNPWAGLPTTENP